MQRLVRCVLILAFAAASQGAMAAASSELTAISDYAFRGVDRSDGPAIQGELDYLRQDGLYAGTWMSNARADGGSEFDAYGGWSQVFTALGVLPLRFDGGAIGYLFPGDENAAGSRRNLDFAEVYAGLRMGPAALKAYFSPDYAGCGGTSIVVRGTVRWPITHQLSAVVDGGLELGPGLRRYTRRLTKDGEGRNYFDYKAALEYTPAVDWTLSAGVAGTTLDIADAPGRSGSQPRLLVSISKHFDF